MKLNRIAALTLCFAGVPCIAHSQQRITVGPNVQVSAARKDVAHIEVTLAADPRDSNHMLACSMMTNGVGAYVSFDEGLTWAAPVVSLGAPRANDPTCAYGPGGVAYFLHKQKPIAGPSDIDRLMIHRSLDGGRTWEAPIRGPQTTDRPWMAFDDRPEEGKWGRLFVSYNYHVHGETTSLEHGTEGFLNAVALQSSVDGGRTFTTFAMRALLGDSAYPFRMPGMGGTAVLTDGTVLVLYEHGKGGGRNPETGKTLIKASTLMVLRSRDRGDTFDPALAVADIKSSYNKPNTRTVTATIAPDRSNSRFRDNVYVVWGDVGSGRTEIMISKSSDHGTTWSPPVRVSDASAGIRPNGGPDQFMPTVAVNKDGVVGVLWYDRRDSDDNLSYYARFSASVDGGATWLPSVRVSESPNTARGTSGTGVTGGDTSGLAASPDGRFHALLIDNRTGIQQVWIAPITVQLR
jgi:hypothetical protein